MTSGFSEGYNFFQRTAGAVAAAFAGGEFGTERAVYVGSVENEIRLKRNPYNRILLESQCFAEVLLGFQKSDMLNEKKSINNRIEQSVYAFFAYIRF